jgi:hypothetical protein
MCWHEEMKVAALADDEAHQFIKIGNIINERRTKLSV